MGCSPAYRAACSRRFRFMAIILHDKFCRRSWFGSWLFVLLYSFHIWVPSGSCFCITSGSSRSAWPPSFCQWGK